MEILMKLAIEVKLVVGHSDLLKPIKTDFAAEAIWDDHWLALTQFVLVSKLDLLFPLFSLASSNYFRVSCFGFTISTFIYYIYMYY